MQSQRYQLLPVTLVLEVKLGERPMAARGPLTWNNHIQGEDFVSDHSERYIDI